jgi:AcrR family transcriptional regulator
VPLREVRKARTRERLLAALIEIARDGYASATVEGIAAGAGVTRATFYLHFRSKADAAEALRAAHRARGLALLTGLGAVVGEVEAAAWLDGFLDAREALRPEAEALADAAPCEPRLAAALGGGHDDILAVVGADLAREAPADPAGVAPRARALAAQLAALLDPRVLAAGPAPDAADRRVLAAVLAAALAPDGAAAAGARG